MSEERRTSGNEACYHCGLPVAAGADIYVEIDGLPRPMCCPGCAAVAHAIVDNGLIAYYRQRAALPESPHDIVPPALQELGLFDHPEFQKSFVRPVGESEREADLILEGITCAACVWLNEQHLARQPGVTAVQVNYATRRARVRWHAERAKLSDLLAAISAIGYRAHPFDPQQSGVVAQKERRAALWRLLVAGFGMMQVMMYAFPVYIARAGDMTADIESLMRWASLFLTLPVMGYSAAPFFSHAWRDLRLRRLGMDVPVAVGIGAAFLASVWATFQGGGAVYFDSVTMFVFLLLGGRYLEMSARQRALRGVEELARVVPAFAERFIAWPEGVAERVPVAVLAAGDVVRIRPGEAVPVDGEVIDGVSEADESWLTGESRAVPKRLGDTVACGSINGSGPLIVRALQVGETTRIASIRQLIERAGAERPRLVAQADRFAARFVAVLLVLACVTALYWWRVDPSRAVWVFAAVLVVSCPCALSLATPVALTVATDHLVRLGLLVTRGHAIETLARADCFVFDKTGTLTEGRMALHSLNVAPGYEPQQCLAVAAGLEQASEHAIGRALAVAAGSRVAVSGLRAFPGRGIEGVVAGERLRIGGAAFVTELAGAAPAWPPPPPGCSRVFLGGARGWRACFALTDPVRGDASLTLAALKAAGLKAAILSGDDPATVEGVARTLGVEVARGGLLPEDKQLAVKAWQEAGALVAMVGDGINDAPVLAQAHVSVALAGGTSLARNQADIVLLGEALAPLVAGRVVARRTLAVIRQNLAWAFAYNVLAIPAAMCGLVTPWMAGIGMSASSLLVVLNALRLRRDH